MTVRLEVRGKIGLVTIDRPQAKNAIDLETDSAFRALWPKVNTNDDIQIVIVTGAGEEAFCSGADIGTFLSVLKDRAARELDDGDFCGMTLNAPTPKPLIAAINGYALAGGLEIALACDLRLASTNATFGLPEVRWGVLAGAGGVTKLPRLLPRAIALEMIVSGRPIDAQRALHYGLVSNVVPQQDLLPSAFKLAETILSNSPVSVKASLHAARNSDGVELRAALSAERMAFRRVVMSDDFREGVSAFTEKRKPQFKGS